MHLFPSLPVCPQVSLVCSQDTHLWHHHHLFQIKFIIPITAQHHTHTSLPSDTHRDKSNHVSFYVLALVRVPQQPCLLGLRSPSSQSFILCTGPQGRGRTSGDMCQWGMVCFLILRIRVTQYLAGNGSSED